MNKRPLPDFFITLKSKLKLSDGHLVSIIEERLKTDWSDNHFLPPEYAKLLKERISQL